MEYPKSKNVGKFDSEYYYITAASWDIGYGPSYEIGIRRKSNPDDFELLQGGWLSEGEVCLAGKAVTILLDAGFAKDQLRWIFRG